MVKALGADEVIDYTAEDFVNGGQRFDVMLDVVGNRSAAECLSVLKPEARYVVISGPKENRWLGPVPKIVRTALAFKRRSQSFHQFTAAPNHDDLKSLGELLASGEVIPQIDRVIGLDDVAAGLAEIGTGHTRAKILVVPD
jgi:NADPH:quinone reductase-like Zn-dependent oxidoreductase